MRIDLTLEEIVILDRQDSSSGDSGGWQQLLVKLQGQLNRDVNTLALDAGDLEKIPRYAFDYGNGGWEDRLTGIFGRTLGPTLGR